MDKRQCRSSVYSTGWPQWGDVNFENNCFGIFLWLRLVKEFWFSRKISFRFIEDYHPVAFKSLPSGPEAAIRYLYCITAHYRHMLILLHMNHYEASGPELSRNTPGNPSTHTGGYPPRHKLLMMDVNDDFVLAPSGFPICTNVVGYQAQSLNTILFVAEI